MFYNLNEAFDALITTQKPQLSARSHFLKNQEKPQKMVNFEKLSYWAIFLDSLQKRTLQRAGGFLRCN